MEVKYSYKEARLVVSPSGYGSYVVWWAYCALAEKVKRFRKNVKTKAEGDRLCAALNEKLRAGAIMNREERAQRDAFEKTRQKTVGEALQYFWENKPILRKDTYRSYKSHYAQFLSWCGENDLLALPVSSLLRSHILQYLDHSINVKGNSAKTRNTKLENLRTFFNFLVERQITPQNPCEGIANIREQQSKTQAISPALVPVIRSLFRSDVPLHLFTSFMYYCFIRPKELLMLTWDCIDVKAGKIFMPAHISKNGKSEYIILPSAMKEILLECYEKIPVAGRVFDGQRYEGLRLRQIDILEKNGLPKYGLYEWKHTGVTAFFRAGVNIKYIQQQCRHSSLDYTDKYLKGLGLIDNADVFDNIPKI